MQVSIVPKGSIELRDHPPCSPHLAPCDFYLLPNIKNKWLSQRFSTDEDLVEGYNTLVLEITISEWHKCFDIWFGQVESVLHPKQSILKRNKIVNLIEFIHS